MTLARRLLAGSLVLVVALVAAIVIIAGGRLRRHLDDELTSRLEHEARLLSTEWKPGVDVAALAARAGDALGHRVTIIDDNGVVIGDSEFDEVSRRRLENHYDRPEVAEARRTGRGTSRRLSVSAGDNEVYVALKHPMGYVRVSLATRNLDDIVVRAQRDVLVSGLIALLGALVLTVLFARSISQPVVELRDVARAIAAGDLERRPALSAPGEIGDLATALHRMAEQLGNRLQALQADDLLMIALLESLEEGVLAFDERGSVVRMNQRARTLLNVAAPVPFGRELLPREHTIRSAIDHALAGESTPPAEVTLFDRTVSIASRPMPPAGVVVTLLDLTVLRKLETIRRDFVANVSHELKTPLTAVSGFAETLLDDSIPSDQRRRFVETIRDNAGRMQRIVDDLLDLSRIESGGWQPMLVEVDVSGNVSDLLTTLDASPAAKGLQLTADIAPGAETAYADPTAFRQILTNLVENAVRYTRRGSVTVRARAGEGGIWIDVIDTGVGIAAEHLPRIFERFYRADASRSREQGGTGLGLAIVRHLVDAHHGRVDAASTLNEGTTISVFFPAPAKV